MHAAAARATMQHRHRRVGELEERALINLPFPIPSIPILDPILKPLAPILTPLIDGTHPTTSTTSTQHTTSTTATQVASPTTSPTTQASSPTSTSASSGGSNSSGNSGSNSSGSSGSDTSGNSGSSQSSGSNDGSGTSNDSGSSNGNSGGGSSGNSGSASSGTAVAGGASNASGAASGAAAGASGTALSIPGALVANPSSAAQGSDAATGSSGSAATTGPIVNANGAFVSGTTIIGGTTYIGTNTATATGSDRAGATAGAKAGSPTGSDSGSTSSTTQSDPSNPSATGDAAVHHGLSTGIIVAICVIVGVLFLLFLAFCCRRRAVAKRLRRRKTWFNAGAYGGAAATEEYKDGATRSARSSFATHFDRGDVITPAPQIDLSVPTDEMSQVWPSNMSGSIMVPAASRTTESHPSPTIRAAPDRTSLNSLSSAGSRPPSQTSQYLAAPDAAATQGSPFGVDFPSPFSVRPFSPSETFSFPRPPQDDARSRASGMMTGSVVSGSISSAAFFTAEDAPEPEPAENPFLDFTEVRPASAEHSFSAESVASSVHFAATETIRRPFVPTMDDEMAVVPGQDVRILARFDDGWAHAELLENGTRGLIPIDTLRPVEEALPAFLAKKRLSSYGARRASAFSGASVGKAM
ncbi:uncharacterized protein TRAVEDRAFT_64353 [Trametes versicolor FP-101664 SS1]|uniref:uncharacterized protein n=1 Tax=Trametes versicolor (strain FP-101664) TaxID=717944 RepID=UPI0004624243|nr:uncharacterized protein TRAVEDRAFT_64353 [Trametes versicolor FP-101664 SS1]EIW59161.1 hypothetical protein TRAVEDRAFT_64353 [Trametes versicolor FP-101664 SS1]